MTTTRVRLSRRLPVGAEVVNGGAHFRVWAPRHETLSVILVRGAREDRVALHREDGGYFSGSADGAAAGDRYWFAVGRDERYPDPASRYQPEGPHGPSAIVDPNAFTWTDHGWAGVGRDGQVLYEMHVGTFTREGTWLSAAEQLPELARLGITVIELMPSADFVGSFGWGYDGVDAFAPTRLYGRPDDLRTFVDRAHAAGIGVIHDVVYNHLGPDGCYLTKFSDSYFSTKYKGEWGDPLNFDGEASGPVREFFIENAGYWIDEFHFDGLRLDATQSIIDASPVHVIREIVDRARAAAGTRQVYVVAENEPQQAELLRPVEDGGYGLDAVWNDDFHHSAIVAMTGQRQAYYTDYAGRPQEFVSAAKRGYLYQGQRYAWQSKTRGEPTTGLAPHSFIVFTENHDQVANSPRGERVHHRTAAGVWRAMTALVLLGPSTPMLFQGQEFAASTPFFYFADHEQPLADAVRNGRIEFLSQFPGVLDPAVRPLLPAPGDRRVFERSVLDFSERERHAEAYALHRDLLAIRHSDAAILEASRGAVDGAVLSARAFVLRYFGGEAGDRLLIVNLGSDFKPSIVPEPLLAPPAGARWELRWSSEHPAYGGLGTPPFDPEKGWLVTGQSTLYLQSVEKRQ
jgi:maltooligosyltrehalose trehalohydrolase